MTIGKDDTPPEHEEAQVRAYMQWCKEHPNERKPISHGNLGVVDTEAGDDLRKQPVKETTTTTMPDYETVINPPEEPEASVGFRTKGFYSEKFDPDGTRTTTYTDNRTGQTSVVSVEKPARLPDNYQGISFEGMNWKEAQMHHISRQDLDFTLPQSLPPDILSRCNEILIYQEKDRPEFYQMVVFEKKPDSAGVDMRLITYRSVFPVSSYVMSFKEFIS
jgi:hypothetical protein